MDWSLIIDKVWQIGAAAISSTALWKVAQSWILRNKIRANADAEVIKKKAEAERIVSETQKELILMLHNEISYVNRKYQDLAKEFANFKFRAAKELSEEKESCAKQIHN